MVQQVDNNPENDIFALDVDTIIIERGIGASYTRYGAAVWMMAYFEKSIRSSWPTFFPRIMPKGWHFHYCSAWIRPKLNTSKITHHPTHPTHHKLLEGFQA